MSTEQIKLLESIRDGIELLGDRLGGQIGETNGRLGRVEVGLGQVEVALVTGLGEVNQRLTGLDSRVGNVERQLEVTNHQLDTLVRMHSHSSITLSSRADQADNRITSLEHRVDKLEETG